MTHHRRRNFFSVLSQAGCALLVLFSTSHACAATILVFGDSISAAYGLEVKQGWVTLLQQKLDKAAPGRHVVVNGSLSGETTSGGKTRLPPLLKKHQPALVIIELGGNDGLRGQPPPMMAANLKSMIAEARQQKAKVVLFGMRIPPNYGRAYTQAFEKVFVTVSQQEKVPLLPFFLEGVGGHPDLVQADGIHPVAKAQARLLDNAWPLIKAELEAL